LEVVLCASLGSVALRDLFPLATYTRLPKDSDEGWLIWAKVATLVAAAVVVPLFRPRIYAPVDPQNPMEKPNAEQTSSWFSALTYIYLDPLILRSFKQGALRVDQLPVLADSDASHNLTPTSFSILDPQSPTASKTLLRGIFRLYREWSTFVMNGLLKPVLSSFLMNDLTLPRRSLETEQPVYRPWVWVLLLFVAPSARSLTQARYTYHSCRQRVQLEGILIQLMFKHSLRLRLSPSGSEKSDSRNLIGRMNNLVTSDVATISGSLEFWLNFVVFPLQITLGMTFLYSIMGWSALVGLAIVLLTLPTPYFLGKQLRKYQIISRKKTDARVQQVTESVSVLRTIKSFALEDHAKQRIAARRAEELAAIWTVRLLTFLNKTTNFIIPLLIMLGTFSTYTLVMKQKLTASIVFTALTVLDGILRPAIERAIDNIPGVIQAKVSIDRIDEFLRTTELLDSLSDETPLATALEHPTKIGFQDAEFSWSVRAAADEFKLRIGSPVVFTPGVINLVVGPTGVGKTAMLLALLGEMHVTTTSAHSWVNLPRDEGVAYAAQQPWIENATIKQNIVFDSRVPFNEERYKKVVNACALHPDLEIFAAGDETEIGEKGLSLSGGQRSRVSLARAIYSMAKIVLLDDIFSALDVHTAKWIIKHCFCSDLVKGRTIILVTHHLTLVRHICGHVVSINSDGSISQGSIDKILASETALAPDEATLAVPTPEAAKVVPSDSLRGKLMVEEKVKSGMVKWSACKLSVPASGHSQPVVFLALICALLALNESTSAFQVWFLGFWSRQYIDQPAAAVNAAYYLRVYTCTVLVAMTFYISALTLYAWGTLRAIKTVHEKLIAAIVGTTLRFLDTTPMSRVLARTTQDTNKGTLDSSFANGAITSLERTIGILAKFVAVMIILPSFLLPGAIVTLASALAGWIYLKAQLPIQREMSAARSPMLAHFAAAVAGLTSIRAYRVEDVFLKESGRRVDLFTRPAISFWNLNRWITVRSDTLGAVYSASLGWYLLLGPGSNQDAANVGFSLTMAMSMTGMILWWVRVTNTLQLDANNLERIEEYIEIEQEPKPTKSAVPPAYWPASGKVVAENLSARYSTDGPEVLHNINFEIQSGERIGIVGRTGSGKSSLTLALLRFIPTEGRIYYDNLRVDKINLDSLRSNIAIIPQVPELLAGTLRSNLDPFGAHEDSVLNDALRGAGLFSLRIDGQTSGLTLDSVVAREGGNLSLGERQIVAMARAIVRRSPLVVLDEATSAIDFETDALIQTTLRNEFRGTTVISVAHRLQTVMDYDRIMVLDAGCIVEFGSPKELVRKEKGLLRAMIEDSSDREVLLAVAQGQRA
ncbi:P-loop containing nucleoside triphosphate hydrolase protein, partial [Mycena amicta]